MATFGSLEAYDSSNESWTDYIERMEHFFLANDITTTDKKKSILLSCVGAKTYKLMKTLLAPVKPGDKSFQQLVALVQEHECPQPSIIVQRFKFNSRVQKQGESVTDFVADLRHLAEHCSFGTTLEEMLRDRIVCGTNNIRTQRRLLSEKNLKFAGALEIAQAMESAEKNAQDLHPTCFSSTKQPHASVHKLSSTPRHGQTTRNPLKGRCFRCGSTDHRAHECKHTETVCHNCGIKGHLASVCQKPKKKDRNPQQSNPKAKGRGGKQKGPHKTHQLGEVDQESVVEDDTYGMYALKGPSPNNNRPYETTVTVDGKSLVMEVDTGATVSVMGETQFNREFPKKKLRESGGYIQTYTGEKVKIAGVCDVDVSTPHGHASLPLMIVPGQGAALIGRNWLSHLKLDWGKIKQMNRPLDELTQRYSAVFNDELGTVKGLKAKIHVKENATPHFFKPRTVPFAIKEKVEKEIERLQAEGIISPVEFSEWAAPIVPVLKTDGNIRICGDYKVTINKEAKVDTYPLPQIDDLLAKLAGGQTFTKLDMSHAYQQLELDEESKKYVTISTQKGLFQYNRLPFGVASAPGIFQRTMDSLMQGLPGVVCYLDDILVTGKTNEEHRDNLEKVLQRLEEAGVRLKKEKCVFAVPEVIYLGYRIDAHGLHPVEDKVHAVMDAPSPQNVTELKAYLGLLNYYGRFLPSLSTVLAPLHRLLAKDTKWHWNREQEAAFQESKQLLLKSQVLVHFDPLKPVVLSCDASPYGVGVVLSHQMPNGEERPVAFASRSLSKAEQKYSQLDKEALAIVYGVKKFHKYIYGRHVTILTDHKPLQGIYGETKGIPQMASARIQRWALTLSAYDYTLRYKAGSTHQNADALSRLPVNGSPETTPLPGDLVLLLEYIDSSPITTHDIEMWTKRDPVLSKVLQHVQGGWNDECDDETQRPYFRRRHELSTQDGILLWGSRIVVPPQGRNAILKQLHEGHPGMSRIKQVARSFVWWPDVDSQLEETVKSCPQCQSNLKAPPPAPMNPWPWPDKPWSRIHVDFAGPVLGKMLMIVVDAHSKWIEAVPMDTSTSQATISRLRTLFATHGLPEMLVTDNGRNFTSAEFAEFMTKNGIKHVKTAPYHPASNGLVERAVQTVKEGLRKMKTGTIETKLARFLFHYRNTPHTTTGRCPSQLLFGREVKRHLDLLRPSVGATVRFKQAKQKEQHDLHAHDRHFDIGDAVLVRELGHGPGTRWLCGTVMKRNGPVSYEVRLVDGRIFKRHQDHLRQRTFAVTEVPQHDEDIVFPPEVVPMSSTSAQNDVERSSEQSQAQTELNASRSETPSPILRRSQRMKKAPDKLNL